MVPTQILTQCEENSIVKVVDVVAGFKAHQFLADLGIHEGEQVRVVKNSVGPVIVEIKGTRVAIGRGLANKIRVST
ncbi:MAG: FeoA family protein [Candidatus Heimdallarchaeaceae archaeon]